MGTDSSAFFYVRRLGVISCGSLAKKLAQTDVTFVLFENKYFPANILQMADCQVLQKSVHFISDRFRPRIRTALVELRREMPSIAPISLFVFFYAHALSSVF